MWRLETALAELEEATAALAEIAIENLPQAQPALDRRSVAIGNLKELTADLSALSQEEREDARRRLQRALEAGVQAQQKLTAVSRTTTAEWNQWSRIYRALGSSVASAR
jgi:lipase chaperone LimK